MQILTTLDEFRSWRMSIAPTSSVGFVPTMGALHAGHMKLVENCRAASDVAVVSIFVNPLQFGPNEDLARYPRPFERDVKLCEDAGVDAIFAPAPDAFYAKDHSTSVDVRGMDEHLCGAARQGHFRGVCTVVLKLLNLVQPRYAWFGKKDIQQALILKKMVSDLSLDVEMLLVDTVREPSGLAMSSRNAYLSEDERERAASIYRGLLRAQEARQAGESDAKNLKRLAFAEISASRPDRVDYVEIVSQASLQPISSTNVPSVLAVAVYYGQTRLIDNILFD